jgi:uncharacterized protein
MKPTSLFSEKNPLNSMPIQLIKNWIMVFLFLGVIIFAPPQAQAAAEKTAPDQTGGESFSLAAYKDRAAGNMGSWLATLFRDYISRVDGDRCPSLPSCSSYSVQAFKKHGFFMGWLLTVDRLIHEGSEEVKVSPLVYYRGRKKIFDPVENNDFWWYKKDIKDHE